MFKVGDIVKYKPLPFAWNRIPDWICDNIIVWSTKDNFNHASMVTEIVNGYIPMITETHSKTGTVKKELDRKWFSRIQIVRPKCSDTKKKLAAMWWEGKIGCKYDMQACILTGVRGFFNLFRKEPLIFDANEEFFCSNGIAMAYDSVGVKISDIHPSQCTPSDINRIGKYGEIIYEKG